VAQYSDLASTKVVDAITCSQLRSDKPRLPLRGYLFIATANTTQEEYETIALRQASVYAEAYRRCRPRVPHVASLGRRTRQLRSRRPARDAADCYPKVLG
jgi:hypothetical protein